MKPPKKPGPGKIARMNMRQRKKLHVAEFTEIGLFVEVTFQSPLDEDAWDSWILRWMDTAAEHGLEVGGFGGKLPIAKTDGWLFLHPHGSVTDAQAAVVKTALEKDPAIAALSKFVLADGWYENPAQPE